MSPSPPAGQAGAAGRGPRNPATGQVASFVEVREGSVGAGGGVVRASLFPVTKFLLFYKLPQ